MKEFLLKRKNALYLALILGFVLAIPSNVFAEEGQCTYTNYYFFSDINGDEYYTSGNAINNNPNGIQTATYFPALEGSNLDPKIEQYRVCLTKNGVNNYDVNCAETWEVSDFWSAWAEAGKSGKVVNFTNGEAEDNSDSATVYQKDATTKYFLHGQWFTIDTNGNRTKRTGGYGTSSVSPSDLTAASFLPSTKLSFDLTQAVPYATVTRTIAESDYSGISGFSGCTSGANGRCMLSPALYKVEYEVDCEGDYNAKITYIKIERDGSKTELKDYAYSKSDLPDGYTEDVPSPSLDNCNPDETEVNVEIKGSNFEKVVTYTCDYDYYGRINYYVKDSKGNKIEITDKNNLKFDNNAVSPWFKSGLEDGYTTKVPSPALKNCNPDKTEVNVEIKGSNFEDEVIYTCTISNTPTGNMLIYVVWAVGAAALGYSIYYFAKNKKEEA